MTVFQALLLGLVQGLTEFLPVSSSGHLVLLQRLMNVNLGRVDMLFDLTLHLGTLFAVCVVFRKKIIQLFKRPFKTLLYLVFATVPAAVAGLLFDDFIDDIFFGGRFLWVGFAATAVLLAAAQIKERKIAGRLPLKFGSAFGMGLAQAVAVIPGISRSGATVAAGILLGRNREEVADFSFLLSIPIILGSFVVGIIKGIYNGELADCFAQYGSGLGFSVAVSVMAAAIAGLFAIKIMIKCISSAKYTPFIIYLCMLSVTCAGLTVAGIL